MIYSLIVLLFIVLILSIIFSSLQIGEAKKQNKKPNPIWRVLFVLSVILFVTLIVFFVLVFCAAIGVIILFLKLILGLGG